MILKNYLREMLFLIIKLGNILSGNHSNFQQLQLQLKIIKQTKKIQTKKL